VWKELFWITNPHLADKVKSVYTVWLPKVMYGKPSIFKEWLRDESDVDELLKAEIEHRKVSLVPKESNNALSLTDDAIAEFANIERQLAEAKERSKEMRDGLLLAMKENGVKSFKCDRFMLTRVIPSGEPAYTLDTERLKDEHPEIWEEYKKEKKQSESLRIKLY